MAADEERLEALLGTLRASGGRITSQRRAILEAMIDHNGHPTAEQLAERVQGHQPDVHESTIYRFLDDLERLGIVDHAHLGHGPAVYHFAADRHYHLVCDACGRVIEVPSGVLEGLRRQLLAEFEFQVDSRHFGVIGHCKACAGQDAPRAPSENRRR